MNYTQNTLNISEFVAESINYDYLPGEPESRKIWFITLRFPPMGDIVRGEIFKFSGNQEFNPIKTSSSNTPFGSERDNYFKIMDIHGRNLVIVPSPPPLHKNVFRLIRLNEHPILTNPSNISGGNVSQSKGYKTLYSSNSDYFFPRVGKYQYPPRPGTVSSPHDYNMIQ